MAIIQKDSIHEWYEARTGTHKETSLFWIGVEKKEGKDRRDAEYLNTDVNNIHGHFHNLDAIFRFMCGWHVLFGF